ncbi:hypothetical protein, partial [Symbiobacterium thermophilum]
PVQGLQVADDGSATFRLPDRCPGDGTELLVVSPGGSETAVPLAAGCNFRKGADSPYRTVPLQIAGRSLDVPALLAPNGAVLVPEDALAALGVQPEPAGQPASVPGRTYWRLGDRFGAYTPGRVTAWVAGERVRLSLPVQPYDGVVYVDKAFVQRLAGVEIRLVNGVAHVGGH